MNDNLKLIDKKKLFRVELIVDREAGEIKCLWPVTVLGEDDFERVAEFHSNITVQLRGMPYSVGFMIEAKTLEEAIDKWHDSAVKACADFEKHVKEQEARPKIVMPGGAQPQKH